MIIDVHAHYIPKLLYDNFDAAALPYVLGRLARNFAIAQGKSAPGRIMLGSDMPFPIGDPEPAKLVHASRLDDAAKPGVLAGNAQEVFRIRPDCWCGS